MEAAAGRAPGILHWYDLTCPFCYVGQHRTEILVRHGLDVTDLPFQAHPDIPPGGIQVGPRTGSMYAMLEGEAAAAGLPLRWPPRIPNSRLALAAAEWVRRNRAPRFRPFQQDLFAAHFALGEDLGARDVILRHAEAAGVDRQRLKDALEDDATLEAVSEAEALGRRHGVRGTPAWLIEGHMIAGLRPADDFERLASSLTGSSIAAPPDPAPPS